MNYIMVLSIRYWVVPMVEKNYKLLFEFISYFEDDSIQFCNWQVSVKLEDGVCSMPYPVYDDKLHEFIQAVYDSAIMLEDYLSCLPDSIGSVNSAIQVIADTKDVETLRAILTYFVRQERFCDGSWAEAAEKKIFYNILLKLKELEC
jgi:hypothetical protein